MANDGRVETLGRDEVAAAIERRGPPRIPLVLARWWTEGLQEQYGDRLLPIEEQYPEDAAFVDLPGTTPAREDLPWCRGQSVEGVAKDAACLLPDWSRLEEFLEAMPDLTAEGGFDNYRRAAEVARAEGRYVLAVHWHLFFERVWQIRGMQNLLMDYYLHPDQVHRLHRALCDQYKAALERAIEVCRPDGFWTSDDLGNQRQLMMKPDQFREFIQPYYAEIGEVCRAHGVHFWLHSCGNNTEALPGLIEAGLDVFHPVQKHTMDEPEVANDFGDRLTFLAGIDVQHVLQEGTPEQIRREVRYLVDTFDRPGGGMMLAAGNGIVSGTPLENIEAFFDEAVTYGTAHRRQW